MSRRVVHGGETVENDVVFSRRCGDARNALVCRPHNFAVRVEREKIGVSTRVVGVVVRIQDVGELEAVVGENGMDERSVRRVNGCRVLTLVDEVAVVV